MSDAAAAISREIAVSGVVSFARFMELSLYGADTGYYERHSKQVGCQGDFYTSVSVGPVFGELLACQCARWLERLGTAGDPGGSPGHGAGGTGGGLRVIEAGAHDGTLAGDLLDGLGASFPQLLDQVEYGIVEPSATRRKWQAERLKRHAGRVRWWRDWGAVEEAGGVRGVLLSNELLDAFPVHRLGWDAKGRCWFEWGVGGGADGFHWERLPVAAQPEGGRIGAGQLPALPEELLAMLPDGFTTEVCPAAVRWWRQAASALRCGVLCTLDYGLTTAERFLPGRHRGTLRAYRAHRLSDDLLASPGEQDLTAHVDFSAIQEAGEAVGLTTETLSGQGRFLTRILQEGEASGVVFPPWTPARLRQFQALTHPEHLGGRFSVLVQSRGLAR